MVFVQNAAEGMKSLPRVEAGTVKKKEECYGKKKYTWYVRILLRTQPKGFCSYISMSLPPREEKKKSSALPLFPMCTDRAHSAKTSTTVTGSSCVDPLRLLLLFCRKMHPRGVCVRNIDKHVYLYEVVYYTYSSMGARNNNKKKGTPYSRFSDSYKKAISS